MKRVILRTFVVVVGLGLFFSLPVRGVEPIKLGFFINPPSCYLDPISGKVRGAAVEFFKPVAAEMGYPVEWVGPIPFIRLQNELKDGTLDGFVGNPSAPAYREFLYYGDKPSHAVQSHFVVRKENPLTQITSIQDVEGYRVGWLADTAPSPFVRDNLSHFQMDYIAPGDMVYQQLMLKLLDGRLDATHNLTVNTSRYIAAQMHVTDKIKILALPEPPLQLYVVFSKKSPRGAELIARYNEVHATMHYGQEDYDKCIQQEIDAVR